MPRTTDDTLRQAERTYRALDYRTCPLPDLAVAHESLRAARARAGIVSCVFCGIRPPVAGVCHCSSCLEFTED